MLPSLRLIVAGFLCGFVVMFAGLRLAASLSNMHGMLPIMAAHAAPMPPAPGVARSAPVPFDLQFAVRATAPSMTGPAPTERERPIVAPSLAIGDFAMRDPATVIAETWAAVEPSARPHAPAAASQATVAAIDPAPNRPVAARRALAAPEPEALEPEAPAAANAAPTLSEPTSPAAAADEPAVPVATAAEAPAAAEAPTAAMTERPAFAAIGPDPTPPADDPAVMPEPAQASAPHVQASSPAPPAAPADAAPIGADVAAPDTRSEDARSNALTEGPTGAIASVPLPQARVEPHAGAKPARKPRARKARPAKTATANGSSSSYAGGPDNGRN
jgi:hypothetical protein